MPSVVTASWIDLFDPTPEEQARILAEHGVRVPSRAQLDEIESSSRLRSEGEVLFLSMPLMAADSPLDPVGVPIGFILTPKLLITVRYSEVHSTASVRQRIDKGEPLSSAPLIFVAIIEAMVDFGADYLEKMSAELGAISRVVFNRQGAKSRRAIQSNPVLRQMLTAVGATGAHVSQLRESLLGLQRIVTFTAETKCGWLQSELRERLRTARLDLSSLTDFEAHLSGKIQFLLDAILGFINTDQNDMFRVLTVVSVVGIPPTLIASMYGMNFHNMPELTWPWGYQYGLGLIALSTILPILWFKWRGWW
jgi:magnesium transporter